MAAKDYLRERFMPHIWCPGCGHGIVLNNLVESIDRLGLNKNDLVLVTGIGCSARISGYVDFHTLHTIHGRALTFATGVKLARPELTLLVAMGDGDALAIGGNHFIHAARRNIDITALIMNNRTYGMTGGQHSPLTGYGMKSITAPLGNIEQAFDTMELAKAAGASFVARGTTYHVRSLQKLLTKAIRHKGFSVVEILTQCPTYFGRKTKAGTAVDMLQSYRDNTVPVGSEAKQKNPELIERGIFVQEERTEFCAAYEGIIQSSREGR